MSEVKSISITAVAGTPALNEIITTEISAVSSLISRGKVIKIHNSVIVETHCLSLFKVHDKSGMNI